MKALWLKYTRWSVKARYNVINVVEINQLRYTGNIINREDKPPQIAMFRAKSEGRPKAR
jgi:hypothetical protein